MNDVSWVKCKKCGAEIPDNGDPCPDCNGRGKGDSALVACEACQKPFSVSAPACPGCGHPNEKAQNKERDGKQKMGCLLFLLSPLFFFVLGPFAGIIAIVGIVMIFWNMRLK